MSVVGIEKPIDPVETRLPLIPSMTNPSTRKPEENSPVSCQPRGNFASPFSVDNENIDLSLSSFFSHNASYRGLFIDRDRGKATFKRYHFFPMILRELQLKHNHFPRKGPRGALWSPSVGSFAGGRFAAGDGRKNLAFARRGIRCQRHPRGSINLTRGLNGTREK